MRNAAALMLALTLAGCATTPENVGTFVGAATVAGVGAAMRGDDRDRRDVVVIREHDRRWHSPRWCSHWRRGVRVTYRC